ncbi:MAG TPA: hypothetical protein VF186_09975 [Gaiellaceae bacterium]
MAENQALLLKAMRDPVRFRCECPSVSCTGVVPMSRAAFAAIRRRQGRFFVLPGHEAFARMAGATLVTALRGRYVLLRLPRPGQHEREPGPDWRGDDRRSGHDRRVAQGVVAFERRWRERRVARAS